MSAIATWAERARIATAACALVSAGIFAYHAGMAAASGADTRTLRIGDPPPGTMEDPRRPLRVEPPSAPLTAADPDTPAGTRMQLLVDATNVPGANVVVDGQSMGRSPWAGDISCAADAEVQVRIESRGFSTHIGQVRCAPGQVVRVRTTLRRLRVQ